MNELCLLPIRNSVESNASNGGSILNIIIRLYANFANMGLDFC